VVSGEVLLASTVCSETFASFIRNYLIRERKVIIMGKCCGGSKKGGCKGGGKKGK